jgi:hypothetical protein
MKIKKINPQRGWGEKKLGNPSKKHTFAPF